MESEQSGAATGQTARVTQSPFGNSEIATLLTMHQGLETSFGVTTAWPASLRTTVAIALAAPFPTFVAWGKALTLIYNDAARALLGARHPHVLGQSLQALFADHWDEIEPLVGKALVGECAEYPNFHFTAFAAGRAEGVWCNLSFSAARDESGNIQGIYLVCGEITSKAKQGASSESESRYRTLFDSMDEGFCIIEFFDGPEGPLSDYIHIEANAAYALHAGIPNVVGQKLREMVGAEAQGWVDLYGGVLRTGMPIRFERELVATARHLELAAFRIEPAERNQVAVLFQDITARKRAELALQENNATLELRVAHALAE
ncbi:MAG: PAS domain-containing protein, partial [Proteobacteria bacterium]|nr:PAS domain-containing protein [Pseudomonadota bacterium]